MKKKQQENIVLAAKAAISDYAFNSALAACNRITNTSVRKKLYIEIMKSNDDRSFRYKDDAIYFLHKTGMGIDAIAHRFGIERSTVESAINDNKEKYADW